MTSEKMEIVWDRQEIEQTIYRLERALDRMDGELMKSCYWDDATEEIQSPVSPENFHYNGSAGDFIPYMIETLKGVELTQHMHSSPVIELNGETAAAESYIWAYNSVKADSGDKDEIQGGRRLFLFEKRDGQWKIKHRSTIFDWNQSHDSTAVWSDKFADKYRSKRDYTDDSYNYIEKEKSTGSFSDNK